MKASELRLGNFLQSDTNIIKIVGVVKKDIYYYHNKKNLYVLELNNFKPLPLTEEWLLKFGFEKYDTNKYSINHFYIRKVGDEFETQIGECLYKTIDYVHQLQNLYFALTKKELTIM